MGAVVNVTELNNSVNVTDVLSSLMSPALVKQVCMLNHMTVDDVPDGTLTKLVTRKGSLSSAAILAEANPQAINAELTDTSVSLIMAKAALVSGLSVEQLKFGNITVQRMAEEHANDIARFIDNDALSLFSGFSNSVTATTILTLNDLDLAVFSIFNSECPNKEVTLSVIVSHRGQLNLKQELRTSGAANYTNESFLEILKTNPQPNCFVGNIPGIGDVFSTSGHATSGGDTIQAVLHPKWALIGALEGSPTTWTDQKGSEGFFTEQATYMFYDLIEWNDGCATQVLSDT